MNILPLALTFLLIFSCIAVTFLKQVKSTLLAETSFETFHRAERSLNNYFVQKAYRKASGETLVKNQTPTKTKKTLTYSSKRLSFPPSDSSKFNLTPLIEYQGELKLFPPYETLIQLLCILYEGRLFEKGSKIEYQIAETLIKTAQKLSKIKTLAELQPKDPTLAKQFYQMLKGTNQYTSTSGIPPLGDFITLLPEKKLASLSFASPPLLEALFGKEIADTILEEEQRKWAESKKYYFFSKDDLQALLAKHPGHSSTFSHFDPLLSYTKKAAPRRTIGSQDKQTGMRLEKNLPNAL